MKIIKLGRERPVLYRGKLAVPAEVISRLAVAQNHYVLSQIAGFNGKVDQYYLVIDNLLSAIIVAMEGSLTTKSHCMKISKFFKHLGRRAKIRYIERSDFDEFYELWGHSRYRLYFPDSATVWKMGLFVNHLFEFSVTEIARYFKSDENLLIQKVDKLLEIFPTSSILEEAAVIHERTQMEAEEFGEIHGYKLGMKLANPWNSISVSILSDRRDVAEAIDNSKKIRQMAKEILEAWDKMISEIQYAILKQLVLEIAEAKMRKKGINQDDALEEAIEAVPTHPRIHNFRVALNLAIDSTGPVGHIGSLLTWSLLNDLELDKHPKKAVSDGWEQYKKHARRIQAAR
jgi:hypothetical protein